MHHHPVQPPHVAQSKPNAATVTSEPKNTLGVAGTGQAPVGKDAGGLSRTAPDQFPLDHPGNTEKKTGRGEKDHFFDSHQRTRRRLDIYSHFPCWARLKGHNGKPDAPTTHPPKLRTGRLASRLEGCTVGAGEHPQPLWRCRLAVRPSRHPHPDISNQLGGT
jgi:hypothetical protein